MKRKEKKNERMKRERIFNDRGKNKESEKGIKKK